MRTHRADQTPADLRPVARRLKQQRPYADAKQLERIKKTALARAQTAATTPPATRRFPSPRALVAVCMCGFVLTMSGVGLAASTVSHTHSAAISQYQAPTAGVPSDHTRLPAVPHDQKAFGHQDHLPLTGYAAIPVLLAGVVLLCSALLAHRYTQRHRGPK